MVIEIVFIRLFEIALFMGLLLFNIYLVIFLGIFKIGILVLGWISKPLVGIVMFQVSRFLELASWTFKENLHLVWVSIKGIAGM